MYRLQSEKDYADFETDYTQHLEKTNGDPKLMKAWLDSNTYKPNRVTARKYNELSARISGQDYLAHQNDKWFEISNKLNNMSPVDALEWANTHLDEYDEASPVYGNLRGFITKTQATLAAGSRALANNQLAGQYRQDSLGFINRMHQYGYTNLNTPVVQAIMQGRSLGLVTEISEVDGTPALVFGERSFTLNTIPNDLLVELDSKIGNLAQIDPDQVAAAIEGNKFAATQLSSSSPPSLGQDGMRKYSHELASAASQGRESGPALWAITTSIISPNHKNPISAIANGVEGAVDVIFADDQTTTMEKYFRLGSLFRYFDYESNQVKWKEYGIKDQEELNSYFNDSIKKLNETRKKTVTKIIEENMDLFNQNISQTLSYSQAQHLSQQLFDQVILPFSLGESSNQGTYMITTLSYPVPSGMAGPEGWQTMTASDYRERRNKGDNLLPVAITETIDNMSNKVGFALNYMDPDSNEQDQIAGMFIGNKNTEKLPPAVLDYLVEFSTKVEDARFAEAMLKRQELKKVSYQVRGLERVISVNPMEGIAVSLNPNTPDLFAHSKKATDIFINTFALRQEEYLNRTKTEKTLIGEAYRKSNALQAQIKTNYPNFYKQMDAMFRYGPALENPQDVVSAVALRETNRPNEYRAAGERLLDLPPDGDKSLYSLFTKINEGDTEDLNQIDINLLQGAQKNYRAWAGGLKSEDGNLVEALIDEDPQVRLTAKLFIAEAAKAASNTYELVRLGKYSRDTIDQYVSDGNYQIPNLAYADPNFLVSPFSLPTTAEGQALLGFVRQAWLNSEEPNNEDQTNKKRKGLANLFVVGRDLNGEKITLRPRQLDLLVSDDEGYTPEQAANRQKQREELLFQIHREQFRGVFKILPDTTLAGPSILTEDGQSTREVRYTVRFTDSDENLDKTLASLVDNHFNKGPTVFINRRYPLQNSSMQSGNEMLRQKEEEEDRQQTTRKLLQIHRNNMRTGK